MSEYALKNNIGKGKMTHRYKLKRNNNESKHTTYLISRNKIYNTTDNRTKLKITRKGSSNYKPNTNTVTNDIVQLQRKRESSHLFLPPNKNTVNTDINKPEVEKFNKQNEPMYARNTVDTEDNDNG